MTEKNKDPNYCHDPDLRNIARFLGVISRGAVNLALSIGEGAYTAFDAAEHFLVQQAEQRKLNKLKQPKTKLSKKTKREIIERNSR